MEQGWSERFARGVEALEAVVAAETGPRVSARRLVRVSRRRRDVRLVRRLHGSARAVGRHFRSRGRLDVELVARVIDA